jgi:preprotein translocase subunit SecE
VAVELKEVLRARKAAEAAKGGGGWWAGVAQEMSEIEWPAPGKVVGTTGVVLGVIAGSTVALLSVNALLAELSDRVFAGRGLQDFFG